MKSISFFQLIPIIGMFIVAGIFFVLSGRKTAQRLAAAANSDAPRQPVSATITSLRRLKKGGPRVIKIVECGPQTGRRGMLIKDTTANLLLHVKRVPAAIANSPCTWFQVGNGRLAAY